MGVKIWIKKRKKREPNLNEKGVGEDITNIDNIRTNGK